MYKENCRSKASLFSDMTKRSKVYEMMKTEYFTNFFDKFEVIEFTTIYSYTR